MKEQTAEKMMERTKEMIGDGEFQREHARINASIFQFLPCKRGESRINCFQGIESGANECGENLQDIGGLS